MYRGNHPFLLTLLLVAIGLRTVFGAPCCLAWESAAHAQSADHQTHLSDCHETHADHVGHASQHHAHHEEHADDAGHEDHAHSAASNPCCSACGPTLPSDPVLLADRDAISPPLQAVAIRELKTRPPFPAYDARGPPILI